MLLTFVVFRRGYGLFAAAVSSRHVISRPLGVDLDAPHLLAAAFGGGSSRQARRTCFGPLASETFAALFDRRPPKLRIFGFHSTSTNKGSGLANWRQTQAKKTTAATPQSTRAQHKTRGTSMATTKMYPGPDDVTAAKRLKNTELVRQPGGRTAQVKSGGNCARHIRDDEQTSRMYGRRQQLTVNRQISSRTKPTRGPTRKGKIQSRFMPPPESLLRRLDVGAASPPRPTSGCWRGSARGTTSPLSPRGSKPSERRAAGDLGLLEHLDHGCARSCRRSASACRPARTGLASSRPENR